MEEHYKRPEYRRDVRLDLEEVPKSDYRLWLMIGMVQTSFGEIETAHTHLVSPDLLIYLFRIKTGTVKGKFGPDVDKVHYVTVEETTGESLSIPVLRTRREKKRYMRRVSAKHGRNDRGSKRAQHVADWNRTHRGGKAPRRRKVSKSSRSG